MKTFRTLVVLKHPRDAIWTAMRDRLPEFAPRIPDISSVMQTERVAEGDGTVCIVNEWRVRYQIPSVVRSLLSVEEIGWIDRNRWDQSTRICAWTIEPFFLAEHIACNGRTVFEPAIGGKGAKIALEGSLDLKPGFLRRLPGAAERPITSFLEAVVTTVIPKNLRAVVEAAAAFSAESPGSADQHAVVKP